MTYFIVIKMLMEFQSTQPKRAATLTDEEQDAMDGISIHAAQEGCDKGVRTWTKAISISIHAAQEGCDILTLQIVMMPKQFQSTQPKRAATIIAEIKRLSQRISIHAAQEGCD